MSAPLPLSEQERQPKVKELPIFAVFAFVAFLATLVALIPTQRYTTSLFELSNWVGPATKSLLENGSLQVMPGMSGARMPMASLYVAGAYLVMGDHITWVVGFKALLLLACLCLIVRKFSVHMPKSGPRAWWCLVLLLSPMVCTATLANLVNLQVEEGYALVPFTALCAHLFRPRPVHGDSVAGAGSAIATGCLMSLLLLTKSAYLPLCMVLLVGYFWLGATRAHVAIMAALLGVTMLAWASYQWSSSGRFTIGTSVDGLNFYKGNNPLFLERYPPAPGTTLDQYDEEILAQFPSENEWARNDDFKHAAIQYIVTHPVETVIGVARKFYYSAVALQKYGSSASGKWQERLEFLGLLITRALFFGALLVALRDVWQRSAHSRHGWLFLAIVGATLLPYLAGFAYTRHVGILIFPCALFLAGRLAESTQ